MGYACPVCDAEQADAVHLANHLAITASLGREDHEEWLAEYAPDWPDQDPETLAATVSEYALEIETPEFESGGGGRAPSLEDEIARQSRRAGRGSLTTETTAVLEEAQELTERMRSADDEPDETDHRDERTSGDAADNENA